MAFTVKSDRVQQLAREAARVTGRSQVGAIEEALVRLLRDYGSDPEAARVAEKLDAVRALVAAYGDEAGDPERTVRRVDDLYDEQGLPPMIVDSSALMAILDDEPGAEGLLRVAAAAGCRMSVATRLEVSIVADARSTAHGERLDQVIEALEIEVVPVSARQGEVARVAYRRYGRGSGPAARLNVGDCFAYALSVTSGEPLLFVGDDFAHTDIAPAARD